MKPRRFLEEFQREWKYHHPISDEQLGVSGVTDTVKGVAFYHGGDVLYTLSEIPGMLNPIQSSSPAFMGGLITFTCHTLRALTIVSRYGWATVKSRSALDC